MSADPREPATVENRRIRRLPRRIAQEARHRQIGKILVDLKNAVRGEAAGMHDTFGNALMVEMGDLFPEMKVLQ